ncbi:MAG: peptide chain release factor N(5)-glutamine methyltransferase [Oscillospiraceae bacterium]|nr:peptide chain release factor N(5)-glutamine methyltransferase [Oscillospiraceae bacterium]
MKSIKLLRNELAQRLEQEGVENSRAESDWIICRALGFNQTQLLTADSVPDSRVNEIENLIQRRLDGEPIQYILGEWDFCDLSFYVGEGVLIPRPETELIVERTVEFFADHPAPVILDLCAGSGCIGLSIAKRLPLSTVFLIEKSPVAMDYIKRNKERHKLRNCVLMQTDVLEEQPSKFLSVSAIVSNPPYIPKGELKTLQREVQREPEMALDGGDDGLVFYSAIAEFWSHGVKDILLLELGDGQYDAVAPLFISAGFEVSSLLDNAGHQRVLQAMR